MAELALRNVEGTLDELEQLERIGLFEHHECKAIVKRRTEFEYKLRRFVKNKSDFVNYINYEISVYQLIQKRRDRTQIQFKRAEIDHSICRRIDVLFRKAGYKYPGDLSLSYSHIEFCKMVKWKTKVAELYTRLLQLHPKKSQTWISCAKYQLEEMGEAGTARQTLQRGIRFNPDDKFLWIEYFKMELHYMEKIQKRQEILEIGDDKAKDAILDGSILLVVFNNAIEAIPEADFAIDFLRISRGEPSLKEVSDKILAIIEEKFENSAAVVSYKASGSKTVAEAFNVFEAAMSTSEDKKELWSQYIKFVLRRAEVTQKPKYVRKALELMVKAGENLSEELCMEQIRLTRDVELARVATKKYTRSLTAWSLRLALECQVEEDEDSVMKTFEAAERACCSEKDASCLWEIIVSWAKTKSPSRLTPLLERGILKPGNTGIFIKDFYVNYVLEQGDKNKLYKLFNRLMTIKPLSMNIYEKFLRIYEEDSQMAKRVFEEAVREFGETNPELWLSYIHFEQQNGHAEETGILYERAVKMLKGSGVKDFVTSYALDVK